MEKQSFCEKLERALFENLGFALNERQKEQMFVLSERLVEVNKVMNLTSIVDEDGIILRHLVDSLFVSDMTPTGASLIDVGCGAGFPSLPLAIFRPDVKIVALDSTEKRIRYVDETAHVLGLDNVRAIAARAEELAHLPNYRERFDVATARAVAALPVLCELALPFVKVGGSLVAMKAKDARSELEGSHRAITTLAGAGSWENAEIKTAQLSGFGICEERAIIEIKKLSRTPNTYPRKYAQIKKSPL